MRFRAGQTGAKLTLLSWLGATSGTTNFQGLFRFGFHGYIMQRRWARRCSIVTNYLPKRVSFGEAGEEIEKRGIVTRLLAFCGIPHDTQGVLTGVQLIEKSQCSPRHKTEREIVPDHFQLGCAERAVHSRYDKGTLMSTCCNAIPSFGSALLSMCHGLSVPQGRPAWLSRVEISRHHYPSSPEA